jgi:formylglycine-generating enzyme required for sulfatase activity
MASMSAVLERLIQFGLSASEYTSVVFYVLTALLLMFTYVVARQDWSEMAAWISLGTVAVAIHFMLVAWRDMSSTFVVSMPIFSLNKPEAATGQIKDCPECPEMVVIQPGYFVMGADDPAAGAEEGPLRRMMIGRRFAISKAAITAAEWAAFAAATGTAPKACAGSPPCLSWQDAQAYTQWLSGKAGKSYRLPSAAEWEYAARGGAAAPSLAATGTVLRASFTTPPAPPVANAFGLAGLSRHSLEVVDDCWSATIAPLPSDGRALTPPVGMFCRGRVVKYVTGGDPLRFSGRRPIAPGTDIPNAGFRVVRDLAAVSN